MDKRLRMMVSECVREAIMEEMDYDYVVPTVIDVIESNAWDMSEEFDDNDIKYIALDLMDHCCESHYETQYGEYGITMDNRRSNSILAFTKEMNTGIARSLTYMIPCGEEIGEYEVKNLIEAMNEAWYNCQDDDEMHDDDEMYESKRSVKRIVDECVRKAVNEAMGRYNGGYNDHGDPISDKKYINSYEYLLDSMINGNWSQAKNMYRKVRNKKDFYDFVSETCPNMLDDINLLER